VPAARPMYVRARSSASVVGDGTDPSMVTTWLGFVPQETWGRNDAASMSTSLSKLAPPSVVKDLQYSRAASQSLPFGANGRPSKYEKVVSSGATMPARAPPSIDMLQTVMRPSIDRPRMAEPRYSTMCPTPPPVPMRPMIARMMSLAVTPAGRSPSTLIDMALG